MYLYFISFPNGKKYIGITTNFLRRKKCHISTSKQSNNKAYNYPVYKAIRAFGVDNITWTVIELTNWESCKEYETAFISYYKTFIGLKDSQGYNCTLGGDGTVGQKLSNETKHKLSEGHKAKGYYPKEPYKGVPWNKGKSPSEASKQKYRNTISKREVKHGALYAYIDLKCRCDLCKTCWSAYRKQRRLN